MEVRSQNPLLRAATGEAGGEDRNREGGYRGGKRNDSTGIGQKKKAGGSVTKRVGAHGRGKWPKTATGGRRVEGLMGSDNGRTKRRHRGGKDEKDLGAKGGSGDKRKPTGAQGPAVTSGSRNHHYGRR